MFILCLYLDKHFLHLQNQTMAQETTSLRVTQKARELARKVAAVNNEKIYVVLERSLQAEYDRLKGVTK